MLARLYNLVPETLSHSGRTQLTFLTPKISSMSVAVCKNVFLLVISVNRKITKSFFSAKRFVTPSVCHRKRGKRQTSFVTTTQNMKSKALLQMQKQPHPEKLA